MTRKEKDAIRLLERSTLAFEFLKFCEYAVEQSRIEGLPSPFTGGMVMASQWILNVLKSRAAPQNAEKLPANAVELSKELAELKNALFYRGAHLQQIRVEGNRRWKILYTPAPPKIYETIPRRAIKPASQRRARARVKKESFDTPPTLIEEAEKLTARQAQHVPELWLVSAPIQHSTARIPYVLCPSCREPRAALYRVDAAGQWLCRACGNFKYLSKSPRRKIHNPNHDAQKPLPR